MATQMKPPLKRRKKKLPAPGRKMSAAEARDYVFKKYGDAMTLLAKH